MDQNIINLNKFLKIVPLKLPFKGLTYEGVCEMHINKTHPILCFNYTYQGDWLLSSESLGLYITESIINEVQKYRIVDSIGEEIFFKVSADVNGEEYTFTNKHLDVSEWWRTKSIPELKNMVVPEKYSFKELSNRFIGQKGRFFTGSSFIIDYTISNVIEPSGWSKSNFFIDDVYYVTSLDFEIVIDKISKRDRHSGPNTQGLSQDKVDAALNYIKNADLNGNTFHGVKLDVESGDGQFHLLSGTLSSILFNHIDEDKLNNITITTDISSGICALFDTIAYEDNVGYLGLREYESLSDEVYQMNKLMLSGNYEFYTRDEIIVSSVNGVKPSVDGDSFISWGEESSVYEDQLEESIIHQYFKENKN